MQTMHIDLEAVPNKAVMQWLIKKPYCNYWCKHAAAMACRKGQTDEAAKVRQQQCSTSVSFSAWQYCSMLASMITTCCWISYCSTGSVSKIVIRSYSSCCNRGPEWTLLSTAQIRCQASRALANIDIFLLWMTGRQSIALTYHRYDLHDSKTRPQPSMSSTWRALLMTPVMYCTTAIMCLLDNETLLQRMIWMRVIWMWMIKFKSTFHVQSGWSECWLPSKQLSAWAVIVYTCCLNRGKTQWRYAYTVQSICKWVLRQSPLLSWCSALWHSFPGM